ncbi:MAG: hypothetical protein ACXWK8_06085, partial [Myxococcaceae bacterium]
MKPLRLLHVGDSEADVLLVERDLRHHGWQVDWTRVDAAEPLRAALHRQWDVVLCDDATQSFGMLEAL